MSGDILGKIPGVNLLKKTTSMAGDLIGGLGGGGGGSTPPPIPTIAHEGVQAAGDAERRRRRNQGLASTMLTSGTGLTSTARTGTTQLLGR